MYLRLHVPILSNMSVQYYKHLRQVYALSRFTNIYQGCLCTNLGRTLKSCTLESCAFMAVLLYTRIRIRTTRQLSGCNRITFSSLSLLLCVLVNLFSAAYCFQLLRPRYLVSPSMSSLSPPLSASAFTMEIKTTVTKVLDINLPYFDPTSEETGSWQEVEQTRLLNQLFIAAAIDNEPAIQVIHVSLPQTLQTHTSDTYNNAGGTAVDSNTQPYDAKIMQRTTLLLRYLAEVHSLAWNEAVAKKKADIQLFVHSEFLPGSSSLTDLLSNLLQNKNASNEVDGEKRLVLLPTSLSSEELAVLQTHLKSSASSSSEQTNTNTEFNSNRNSSFWVNLKNSLQTQSEYNHSSSLKVSLDTSFETIKQRLLKGFAEEEVLFVGSDLFNMRFSESTSTSTASLTTSPLLRCFEEVAVGGTFDHLHPGHTLLLSVAASLCRDTLTVGVTSQQLLQGKKSHDHWLEDYATRVQNMSTFVSRMFPNVKLDVHELQDSCGPAITKEQLQAIVVSSETLAGAFLVNQLRRDRQMRPLNIVVVPRRDAVILSSSFIRAQLASTNNPGDSVARK